jgi:hypothetical protein
MKELIIKDDQGFRLRLTVKNVLNPSNMKNVEFHQESKDEKGDISFSSVYQFFLSEEELLTLGHFLVNMDHTSVSETQNKTFITKRYSRNDPE